MSAGSYISLFAAGAAAVMVSGCGIESVREYDCKQTPEGTREAHVDSRLSTSILTTKETKADGTAEEKSYRLSRYRGTGLAQISAQADFLPEQYEPPGGLLFQPVDIAITR